MELLRLLQNRSAAEIEEIIIYGDSASGRLGPWPKTYSKRFVAKPALTINDPPPPASYKRITQRDRHRTVGRWRDPHQAKTYRRPQAVHDHGLRRFHVIPYALRHPQICTVLSR